MRSRVFQIALRRPPGAAAEPAARPPAAHEGWTACAAKNIAMPVPFADVPLLDHHCHSLLREQPADVRAFRACFTESDAGEILDRHVPWSFFYRRALRDLADFLGCAPVEAEVLRARAGRPIADLVRAMFTDARIGGVLVDLGLRVHQYYGLAELRRLVPCPALPILRIETLAQDLIPLASGWADLQDRFVGAVEAAAAGELCSLKTIVAYRTGLAIERWDDAALRRAFDAAQQEFRGGGRRLASKPLLDTLLRRALDVAARRGLPMQIHTGFGDRDLDLRLADALWLRPVIEDPAYRSVPLILLHGHPYVREAAWLAAVYPNVFLDLSLTVPFLAHRAADAVADALAMAPATKVLLATDAFSIPELYWLGARHAREALAAALDTAEARRYVLPGERAEIARLLLYDNAARLYGVELPA